MIVSFPHKIKQAILQAAPTARVFLFGSRSRGEAGRDSDWDVLVLINKTSAIDGIEERISHALYDLELDTGEIINPLVYSEDEWHKKYRITPFYENVMEETIRL